MHETTLEPLEFDTAKICGHILILIRIELE